MDDISKGLSDKTKMEIGLRMKDIRLGMKEPYKSQEGFAKLVGLSRNYVGDVERGKHCYSINVFTIVSSITGISIDYMINGGTSSVRDKVITFLNRYDDEQIRYLLEIISSMEFFIKHKNTKT